MLLPIHQPLKSIIKTLIVNAPVDIYQENYGFVVKIIFLYID